MLLDTHVLVWAMPAPDRLSRMAHDALARARERSLSAASLSEITCKAMLGKWPEVAGLLTFDLDARLRSDGFEVVPASGAIMARAGRFDWVHRDPFDRIHRRHGAGAGHRRGVEGRRAGRGAGRRARAGLVKRPFGINRGAASPAGRGYARRRPR